MAHFEERYRFARFGSGSRIMAIAAAHRTHSVTAAFRAGREVPTMARWTRSEA
jgi:hypothetical protein